MVLLTNNTIFAIMIVSNQLWFDGDLQIIDSWVETKAEHFVLGGLVESIAPLHEAHRSILGWATQQVG
jgi:hypothetical protein